jgi:conjugal transfer/entry exclusion protein
MNQQRTTTNRESSNSRLRQRMLKRMLMGLLAAAPAFLMLPQVGDAQTIVFDPAIYAKNIQQVAQDYQMLQYMQQQLEQEEAMLARLNIDLLPQLSASENQLAEIVAPLANLANNVEAAINAAYPLDYENLSPDQVLAIQQQWTQDQRNNLVNNSQLEDQVVQQMPAISNQVGQLVGASNSAPGATSAVEAGNQIIATLASQLQQLEALEAGDQRTFVQQQATRQSEAAYEEQQCQDVMSDWNTPAATQAVAMPFTGN